MCMRREARLYVTGNGQGSPCLDLRRVPDTLADATVGTDLVIVEGMGRAIHTNYKCALISKSDRSQQRATALLLVSARF